MKVSTKSLVLVLGVPFATFLFLFPSSSFLTCLVIFCLLLRLFNRLTLGICDCDVDMTGKTVLITGSSAGVGKATAEELAKRNARVIMACRNMVKAKQVADDIKSKTGNSNIVVKHLELESFQSVRNCAVELYRTEKKLDVLINNAGVNDIKVQVTTDGCERVMQTNHLSHFLLTMLLLDLLKGKPSRIINVSSIAYGFAELDVTDMAAAKETALSLCLNNLYNRAKLANILFTRALSKRLDGTGTTVNAVHPGLVKTDIARGKLDPLSLGLTMLMGLFGKTLEEGAQTSVHVAVHPGLEKVSGRFFLDCREFPVFGKASDDSLAESLFKISEETVKSYLSSIGS